MTISISEIINNKYDIQREIRMSSKNKRQRRITAARINEYRELEDKKRRMANILKAGQYL